MKPHFLMPQTQHKLGTVLSCLRTLLEHTDGSVYLWHDVINIQQFVF